MSRIIVFGDSVCWGACDYKKQGWVNRLREYCDNNYENMSIYNCGVGGENSNDLLYRFDVESNSRLSKKTDNMVIFAIGINDSAYINEKGQNNVNISQFESNIIELVNKAVLKYNRVVFLGLTNIDESKTMPTPYSPIRYFNNENVVKYNQVIQKVCKQFDIQFLDIYNLINIDELEDGLHPNSEGHEKIYNKMKEALNLLS